MKRGLLSLILIVALMVVFQQCGGKSGKALKYNNTIVEYQGKIIV